MPLPKNPSELKNPWKDVSTIKFFVPQTGIFPSAHSPVNFDPPSNCLSKTYPGHSVS